MKAVYIQFCLQNGQLSLAGVFALANQANNSSAVGLG